MQPSRRPPRRKRPGRCRHEPCPAEQAPTLLQHHRTKPTANVPCSCCFLHPAAHETRPQCALLVRAPQSQTSPCPSTVPHPSPAGQVASLWLSSFFLLALLRIVGSQCAALHWVVRCIRYPTVAADDVPFVVPYLCHEQGSAGPVARTAPSNQPACPGPPLHRQSGAALLCRRCARRRRRRPGSLLVGRRLTKTGAPRREHCLAEIAGMDCLGCSMGSGRQSGSPER